MARKQKAEPLDYYSAFPTALRNLLKENNMSQADLGPHIGKSRQMIGFYCTGHSSPDWQTIADIARFFKVSADYLLGITDYKSLDTEPAAVCIYTGLSADAVRILHNGTLKGVDIAQTALTSSELFFARMEPQALCTFINAIVNTHSGPQFVVSLSELPDIIERCKRELEYSSESDDDALSRVALTINLDRLYKDLRYQIFESQDMLKYFIDEVYNTNDLEYQIKEVGWEKGYSYYIDEEESEDIEDTIDSLQIDEE